MAHCHHINVWYLTQAVTAEKRRKHQEADAMMAVSTHYYDAARGKARQPELANA